MRRKVCDCNATSTTGAIRQIHIDQPAISTYPDGIYAAYRFVFYPQPSCDKCYMPWRDVPVVSEKEAK